MSKSDEADKEDNKPLLTALLGLGGKGVEGIGRTLQGALSNPWTGVPIILIALSQLDPSGKLTKQFTANLASYMSALGKIVIDGIIAFKEGIIPPGPDPETLRPVIAEFFGIPDLVTSKTTLYGFRGTPHDLALRLGDQPVNRLFPTDAARTLGIVHYLFAGPLSTVDKYEGTFDRFIWNGRNIFLNEQGPFQTWMITAIYPPGSGIRLRLAGGFPTESDALAAIATGQYGGTDHKAEPEPFRI